MQANFPPILTDLFNYFHQTYIGNSDKDAIFPIFQWNHFDDVKNNLPKTNNGVEGWHNVFRSSFGTLNKNPLNFVKKLRKEENVMQKYLRMKNGENLLRKKKYVMLSDNLKNYIESVQREGLNNTF